MPVATETVVMGSPLSEAAAGPELAEIVRQHRAINDRFFRGDPALDEWVHDENLTIHGGFNVSGRGWDIVQGGLVRAAGRLSDGEMTFTLLGGSVAGDLAYLAGFEEGTVRLDGGERRPMKLRVTMVFRRTDGRWLCLHRHGEMLTPSGPAA